MALIIPGSTTATVFEQGTGTAVGGQTSHAFMWKGKLSSAANSGNLNLFNFGGSFVSRLAVSVTENISSTIRTSASNQPDVLIIGYVPDQIYTIFSVWDGTNLNHYVDGVLSGASRALGGTLLSTTGKLQFEGTAFAGEDTTTVEAAIWFNSVPSVTDIQNYPTTALTAFATPPTSSYKPVGSGIVTTLTDASSSNDMTQIAGATVAPDAPTVDGGTPATGEPVITEINGWAVTGSSTLFVPYDKGLKSTTRTVSGTYTGIAPSGVKIKVGTNSYREVSGYTAGGGTWSGSILLEVGEILEYASIDNVTTFTIDDFACGQQFIIAGQSNARGKIGTDAGQVIPANYITGSKIYKQSDTTGAFTKYPAPSGDFHIMHGIALLSRYSGEPVCAVNVAIGATVIASWRTGQSSYTTATGWLTTCKLIGDSSEPTFFWYQGETDEGATADYYRGQLNGLYVDLIAGWGVADSLVIPIKPRASGQPIVDGTLASITDNVTMNQACFLGDILWGLDGIHITSPEEALTIGSRISSVLIDSYAPLPTSTVTVNSLAVSVSGIPDGTYNTKIWNQDGTEFFDGDVTYTGEASTIPTLGLPANTFYGLVRDGLSPSSQTAPIKVL